MIIKGIGKMNERQGIVVDILVEDIVRLKYNERMLSQDIVRLREVITELSQDIARLREKPPLLPST